MATREIEIILTGVDNFSGVLDKGLSGVGVGIGAAITTSILDGISSGLRGVADLFSKQLGKAAEFENNILTGGGAFTSFELFGKDLQTNIDSFSKVFANLEGVAADLPGSTEDYLEILQQTSSIFAKAKMNDITGISNGVRDLGLLAEAGRARGLLPKDVARGLEAFVGGRPFKELKNKGIELFAKGGAFSTILETIIKEEGELKADDAKGRLDQALRAARETVDPTHDGELIGRYRSTFSSIYEGIMTDLFGSSGVFSFTKDLNSKQGGSQNVLKEATNFLGELFGSKGALARLFSALGMDANSPMTVLYNMIQGANEWLFNLDVSKIAALIKSIAAPFKFLSDMFNRTPITTKFDKNNKLWDWNKLFNITAIFNAITIIIDIFTTKLISYIESDKGEAFIKGALQTMIAYRNAVGRLNAVMFKQNLLNFGLHFKLFFAETFGFFKQLLNQNTIGSVIGVGIVTLIKLIAGLFALAFGPKLIRASIKKLGTFLIDTLLVPIPILRVWFTKLFAFLFGKAGGEMLTKAVNAGMQVRAARAGAMIMKDTKGPLFTPIANLFNAIGTLITGVITWLATLLGVTIGGSLAVAGGLLIAATAVIINFFRVVYNNWSMIASLGLGDIPIMFQGILNNWKILGTLIGQHLTNIGNSISRLFSSINSWFINQLNKIPGVNLSRNNAAPLSTEPIVSSQNAVASNNRSVNVNLYGTKVAMTSEELTGMLNRWTNQQAFV